MSVSNQDDTQQQQQGITREGSEGTARVGEGGLSGYAACSCTGG